MVDETGARLSLDEFRTAARVFLDHAASRRVPVADETWGSGDDRVTLFRGATSEEVDDARDWRRTVFDAGFGWITGPLELGGRGLPAAYEKAYLDIEREYETPS